MCGIEKKREEKIALFGCVPGGCLGLAVAGHAADSAGHRAFSCPGRVPKFHCVRAFCYANEWKLISSDPPIKFLVQAPTFLTPRAGKQFLPIFIYTPPIKSRDSEYPIDKISQYLNSTNKLIHSANKLLHSTNKSLHSTNKLLLSTNKLSISQNLLHSTNKSLYSTNKLFIPQIIRLIPQTNLSFPQKTSPPHKKTAPDRMQFRYSCPSLFLNTSQLPSCRLARSTSGSSLLV